MQKTAEDREPLSVTVCNPYIPANEYRQGVVEALECIGPFLSESDFGDLVL